MREGSISGRGRLSERAIRSLVYSKHLILLVRREKKEDRAISEISRMRHKRGTYFIIKCGGFVESIEATVYHHVICINIIYARWHRITSAVAHDTSIAISF